MELSETVRAGPAPEVDIALQRIRDLGVHLSLDDFGTGYASFSYLQRFQPCAVKIDRCFVAALGRSEGDDVLARSLIDLAQQLGCHIVAEGIEHREQLQTLLAHGVLSSVSVPLRVAGTTVGALNSYAREPHGFGEAVRTALTGFAAQSEVALTLVLRTAAQSEVVDQLHTAMQTRSTIDQALGILMTRQRCTAAEAFAVLRSVSQSRNRKIVDIAADLITSATGAAPQDGRFEM